MCTTASPSELFLIWSLVLGPLSALPVILGIAAWRTRRRGWVLAAAGAAALPILFVARGGSAAFADPLAVGILTLFALALGGWIAAIRFPALRSLALGLVVVAGALFVGSIVYATASGPSCAKMMIPTAPTQGVA